MCVCVCVCVCVSAQRPEFRYQKRYQTLVVTLVTLYLVFFVFLCFRNMCHVCLFFMCFESICCRFCVVMINCCFFVFVHVFECLEFRSGVESSRAKSLAFGHCFYSFHMLGISVVVLGGVESSRATSSVFEQFHSFFIL